MRSLIIILAIAVLFRSLMFQSFVIPSGSMEPTLLVGDYILVSKYSYGFSKYSFPLVGYFANKKSSHQDLSAHSDGTNLTSKDLASHRAFFTPPKRGDIVVFKYPSNPNESFVKRVIGLPGDTIQVIGGILYINGKAVKDIFIKHEVLNGAAYDLYKEVLPNGRVIYIHKAYNNLLMYSEANNTPLYKVQLNHFFMMGDNRDYSRDSRFDDVGQVQAQNLEGKAKVIFFSIDGRFLQFWRWSKIRFNRIFTSLYPVVPSN